MYVYNRTKFHSFLKNLFFGICLGRYTPNYFYFLFMFDIFLIIKGLDLLCNCPPLTLLLEIAFWQSTLPGVILLWRKLAKYLWISFVSISVHFTLRDFFFFGLFVPSSSSEFDSSEYRKGSPSSPSTLMGCAELDSMSLTWPSASSALEVLSEPTISVQ